MTTEWQKQLIQVIEAESKKRKETLELLRPERAKETEAFNQIRNNNINAAEAVVQAWFNFTFFSLVKQAIKEGEFSVWHVCHNDHELGALLRKCKKEHLHTRTKMEYYPAIPELDTVGEMEFTTEIFFDSHVKDNEY